ncbi:MAG TPA: hypothetical protein VK524_17130 [Polyangiaceae bacterium]|nr:hypothetical protein [Polyangiaceae bacterium]
MDNVWLAATAILGCIAIVSMAFAIADRKWKAPIRTNQLALRRIETKRSTRCSRTSAFSSTLIVLLE